MGSVDVSRGTGDGVQPGHATGIAWSPAFGSFPGVSGPAFLKPHPFLPNDPWDRGARVQVLHDILAWNADRLPSVLIQPVSRPASTEVLATFHEESYVNSAVEGNGAHPHGYVLAARLAVAAVREACDRVWTRELRNAYALVRPPGHHAEPGHAAGGCLFANGVLAALRAKELGARRILFLDWDAHHGNSQQNAFWNDPGVLTISIHQARSFAPGTGGQDARGEGEGFGFNINVPVPMGSGGGVYRAIFDRVVTTAAERFGPEMVLVSSGLDANYLDPSARLSLHSGDYHWLAARVGELAEKYAAGRLLMLHEGGYSLAHIPICFLRIVEAISGHDTGTPDPFLDHWGVAFAESVPLEARRVIDVAEGLANSVPRSVQ